MTVELTRKEHEMLTTKVPMPEALRGVIRSARQTGRKWHLELSDDDAEEIRDLCGDTLQQIGFDEHYEPNKAGWILEGLVDKFFTG
jgi:hypothetical protein